MNSKKISQTEKEEKQSIRLPIHRLFPCLSSSFYHEKREIPQRPPRYITWNVGQNRTIFDRREAHSFYTLSCFRFEECDKKKKIKWKKSNVSELYSRVTFVFYVFIFFVLWFQVSYIIHTLFTTAFHHKIPSFI